MQSSPFRTSHLIPAAQPIRVGILDDHELMLEGLVLLLGGRPDLTVVGTWSHSSTLLSALAHTEVDVLLLDYALAPNDHACCQLIGTLHALRPGMRIVVISSSGHPLIVRAVRLAGAAAHLCKAATYSVLAETIHAATRLSDGPMIDPWMASSSMANLTSREHEVLRHLLAGNAASRVALQEGLSEKTISTHKRAAYRKLGLRGDADLYRLAPLVMDFINDRADAISG